jgi:hypothetical protein
VGFKIKGEIVKKFVIILIFTILCSFAANGQKSSIDKIVIPIADANNLSKQSAEIQDAQNKLLVAQLKQRVVFLEAVLKALNIEIENYELSFDANGSITLTPKKSK